MMKKTKPLSGRGEDIYYKYLDDKIQIKWGKSILSIDKEIIDNILDNFFIDDDKWYSLGAGMTQPVKGGLGEYLLNEKKLNKFPT